MSCEKPVVECVGSSKYASYTLIILDWDDTLFPSSVLGDKVHQHSWRLQEVPELYSTMLSYDNQVRSTLISLAKWGTLVVITNATNPWVDDSAKRFMPRTMEVFQSLNVKTVYAGTSFEDCPVPLRKRAAFQYEISAFQPGNTSQSCKNVISIGDAIFELDALQYCRENLPSVVGKSVTFSKGPDVGTLHMQLKRLEQTMHWLVPHTDHLDLDIMTNAASAGCELQTAVQFFQAESNKENVESPQIGSHFAKDGALVDICDESLKAGTQKRPLMETTKTQCACVCLESEEPEKGFNVNLNSLLDGGQQTKAATFLSSTVFHEAGSISNLPLPLARKPIISQDDFKKMKT
eukprot:Filipodium_phascolosomae@DN821_c0_g1_i1.p1